MSDFDLHALAIPSTARSIRRWFALPVILAGTFMVTLDFFIVNVAIPSIQRGLHADAAELEWVVSRLRLACAALPLIIGGRLGDLRGRRKIFIAGLAAFTRHPAACGFAPDATVLIAARIAQGISAAFTRTAGTGGARHAAPPAPDRAPRLRGIWRGAWHCRRQRPDDRRIADQCRHPRRRLARLLPGQHFPLAWPRCCSALPRCGMARGIPQPRLDLHSAALVTLSIAMLLLPLIGGRACRMVALDPVASFAAAAIFLAAFTLQRHGARPSEPHRGSIPALFQVHGFRVGLLAVLALFSGVASFFFVLAFYLQQGRGLAPLASGLVFTTMALAFSVTSLTAARINRWLGRAALPVGALGMAIGLGALRLIVGWNGVGGPLFPLIAALLVDGNRA